MNGCGEVEERGGGTQTIRQSGINQTHKSLLKLIVVTALTLLFVGLYWHGAEEQLTMVNTGGTDQKSYMAYARQMRESGYTYIGDRNRMPVYPFIQSLFYRPGTQDELFFEQGKYLNLYLSIGLLVTLLFIFRQFFTWLHSFALISITAFTVFIFKAGYFQTELLYYFANFCLFLLMLRLLQKSSWQLAILTGIVAGLTHLTKASVLPGLLLFVVLATSKWIWTGYQNQRRLHQKTSAYFAFKPLLSIPLVLIFFLLTIFPYISTSKRVFGRYFYNVNSTFYMWYDSWGEAVEGTRAHGDRVGWPDMPPSEIPSMGKYLREHSFTQMMDRFIDGGQEVFMRVRDSYGYLKYIALYTGLLALVALKFRERSQAIIKKHPFVCLFVSLYFAGYFLLYAWYAPIASGNRFILAQFLPLLMTLSWGLAKLLHSSRLKIKGFFVPAMEIVQVAVLLILLIDIKLFLFARVATMYGGS